MSILCKLNPRPDASVEQLKALAVAICKLVKQGLGEYGMIESIDMNELQDLMKGELPQPLAVRIATSHGRLGERLDMTRLMADLGAHASERAIHFTLRDYPVTVHSAIIQKLRQAIPADLVDDVIIDGDGLERSDE